jgi:hypothetical protein
MQFAQFSLGVLFPARIQARRRATSRPGRVGGTEARRSGAIQRGPFERLESRHLLAVNVTTGDDAGTGSLRAAIDAVNTGGIAETIVFQNLGSKTIALASALPPLTNPAGTTFSFGGGTTAIIIDGAALVGADGLTIGNGANSVSMSGINLTLTNFDTALRFAGGSTNSVFKGLTITRNSSGIELNGGSLAGTVVAGNTITFNSQAGVLATGGVTGLTIGGTTAGAGNTVAYNGDGLVFQPGTYTTTVVAGNSIYSNDGSGLQLGTSGGTLADLVVGGSAAAANTITYNKQNGVEVAQGVYTGTLIQGNTISSNGAYGVQLSPAGQTLSNLTIGGTTAGQGNMIASNAADGIGVFGGTYTGTVVQGNTIQYNQNNGVNINLFAGGAAFSGLKVGGSATGAGNTINSNGLDGVQINAGVYTSTFVQGNTITANGRNGVNFFAAFGEKLTGLQLGGTTSAVANTITGNAASGLAASKGDYSETAVLGNTFSGNRTGISLANVQNLNVGGVATAFKNTISSNTETGLYATGNLAGTLIQGNAFTGNPVGVSLQDGQSLSLGSASAGGGNTITGGATGLMATGNVAGSLVAGNSITGQTTGIMLVNAVATSGQPFFVGGAATTVGNGVGNYVASTVHGLYAAGPMTNTTIGGNIFSASAAGGNAMVLVNATGLTVGGSAAGIGNTLTAPLGNALFATGILAGTGVYRNTLTASTNGAVLSSAQSLLFGVANNAALGNIVQYNKVGMVALGNCAGTGVCHTTWFKNVRKIRNTATGLIVFPQA